MKSKYYSSYSKDYVNYFPVRQIEYPLTFGHFILIIKVLSSINSTDKDLSLWKDVDPTA